MSNEGFPGDMPHRYWLRLCAAILLVAGVTACTPEPNDTTLLIPVNPLCTTCDDFIHCDTTTAQDNADPTGTYMLYHLRPKSSLAQMATIFDFLLQAFRQREEDLRPLSAYAPGTEGPQFDPDAEAVTNLLSHRISVPDGWIDQVNGDWHGANDGIRGRCRLLPIAEGRQLIKQLRQNANL